MTQRHHRPAKSHENVDTTAEVGLALGLWGLASCSGGEPGATDGSADADGTIDDTRATEDASATDDAGAVDDASVTDDAMPDGDAGNTITAASCSETDVQNAIDSAANGDTVLVPAGDCTWPSGVAIPDTKGITLMGGVGGSTTITGRLELAAGESASSRVTGFTFTTGGMEGAVGTSGSRTSAPFRIDHNVFNHDGDTELTTSGNAPGLIDHNEFVSDTAPNEMIHNMGMGATDASGWADDVVPGSADMVFIEDNIFTFNATGDPAYFWGSSAVQSYYGARTVFRYNTLNMEQVDQHGTPGMIGARWWEIYENTFNTAVPNASQCCFVSLRAGSGVVFDNHHTGTNLYGDSIDLYEEDTGYPALYQIGRGKDQALDPAYVWGNEAFFSVGSQTPDMVQVDRDYFLSEKPGYTPFPYPYPLDASGLPSP